MKPPQKATASSENQPDFARGMSGGPASPTQNQPKQNNAGFDSDSHRDPSFFSQESDFSSAVLATVGAVVTVLDREGRIVQFNPACEALTGYCFEEVRGRYVWDFLLPPSQVDGVREVFNALTAGLFPNRYENHWVTKAGELRLIAWSNTALVGPKGDVEYVVATGIDITDQRKAEAALKESHERMLVVLNSLDAIVYVADLKTHAVLFVNDYARNIFGDILGRCCWQTIQTGQTGPCRFCTNDRLLTPEGEPTGTVLWDFRNTVNQRWYEVRDRAIRWVDGTLVRLEIATDVTDRKNAERILRESEEKYRLIFENAPLGILHFDSAGNCTTCNDYFADIIGAPREKVLDFNLLRSLKDGRMTEAVEVALSGEIGHFEGEYTSVVGKKTRVLRADFSPIVSDDGTLIGGMGVFEDMTESERLKDELSRAQRLEAAGRVAGQIAHDFNNLLSPLTAYPDLIRLECREGDAVLPLLDAMQTAAIQMADINQQLLTLGRRGHYNLEALSVAQLLDRLLDAMVFPETVVLEKAFDQDLLPIQGGASQLDRAFTNLMTNALEAMSQIGQVTVTARNVYLDVPLRNYETIRRGEYVKVEVIDTGTGIDPQILDRIFDPFFTTKKADRKRGSGLGLSVVQAVTEDHDGYLDVATRPGEGTTFSLYFPITRERPSESKEGAADLPVGTERILVVDDDPFQREVLTHLLAKLGYDVQTATSGEGAVAHVSENPQDLLMLDMIMDGIDGAETYRRIKEIYPEQKALLFSGYAESERVAEAQRMGAGVFIRKPVGFHTIAVAVRRALDR